MDYLSGVQVVQWLKEGLGKWSNTILRYWISVRFLPKHNKILQWWSKTNKICDDKEVLLVLQYLVHLNYWLVLNLLQYINFLVVVVLTFLLTFLNNFNCILFLFYFLVKWLFVANTHVIGTTLTDLAAKSVFIPYLIYEFRLHLQLSIYFWWLLRQRRRKHLMLDSWYGSGRTYYRFSYWYWSI